MASPKKPKKNVSPFPDLMANADSVTRSLGGDSESDLQKEWLAVLKAIGPEYSGLGATKFKPPR